MSKFATEKVLSVHHWNDTLFSFRTTRDRALKFDNGQFVMIGLEVDGRPLVRAYSIASPNYSDELEFYSIKVQNGPLTSRLQNLQIGDEVLVSKKPTGTLLASDLLPGKHLYLLATGTGLAPFICLAQDPELYEKYEKIILIHGVRHVNDLAYKDFFETGLPNNEFFGDAVKQKLIYYPTVTREPFIHQGRITQLMLDGTLFKDIGLPPINPEHDRAMICGSEVMLKDLCDVLDGFGLRQSTRIGDAAHYVIEKAFAEK